MNKEGVGQLRAARLSAFDMNVINNLVLNQGEIEWYPESKKPLTNELVDVLVRKRLIEITNEARTLVIPQGAIVASVGSVVRQYGSCLRMRLTDEGRSVAARLDEMTANPLKVNSAG